MTRVQVIGCRFQVFRKRWNHWWFRDAPPHATAIFRIIFGSYLLFYFGIRLPHVSMLFSREGLVIPYDPTPLLSELRGAGLSASLNFILTPPSVATAYIIFSILLVSLLFFTIGAWTRTCATIAFLLFVYYTFLSFHHYSTSYNRLFLFITFLFTFSDAAGKTFSFDIWRKHGSWSAWEAGSILLQRLIAVQLTATYVGVGWQKIILSGWQGGEILFYSFQGMWATPIAWWFVRQEFPMLLYDAMTFLVKAFEVALPIGLWVKKMRLWFFLGGLLFHAGVALFLAAIWWFFAMPAAYFLFYEPEEIYRTVQRLSGRELMETRGRAS